TLVVHIRSDQMKPLLVGTNESVTSCSYYYRVEGDSHTILARAGEASMGKVPADEGESGRGRLRDAVQLVETLGTAGVRSLQVSVLWGPSSTYGKDQGRSRKSSSLVRRVLPKA
ncbi:hypothetical protein HAX54_017259, partial [Datura stramonium]|nr:hypothetical protein [Datura stramonium]